MDWCLHWGPRLMTAAAAFVTRAAVFLLVLVACVHSVHAAGGSEDNVAFTAQGLPRPNQTDSASRAQRAVLQAYLASRPGVHIEPFAMPSVAGSSMDMGPLMAIAAGIPPHAIYVNFRMSSTYTSQGFLEPIELLLGRLHSANPAARRADADGNWEAEPTSGEIAEALELIRQRVPERVWPVVYRADESGRYPGKHVWAMPTGTLVMALLYRKDLFAAAGLSPDEPPRTWEELLQYARRLTIPERGQHGMMIYGGQALSWGAYTFLVSNGARAVQETEDGEWTATYGSREAAEAVAFLWELARGRFERDGQRLEGAARIGASELPLLWERGQIAMSFASLDEELLGDINPQLVGIAPVPAAPGGSRGSELNARMLGVFSGSSPEQQLAVIDYIWYLTSDEAQAIRTRSYVDSGLGQFVSPDVLEKHGYDRILRLVPETWKQAFKSALAHGVPEPYGRNTQNIYGYMSEPIAEALELDLHDVPHDERVRRIHRLLAASAEKVNQDVLGNVPPDVLFTRRIVGTGALLLVVVAFVSGFVHVWRYFSKVAGAVQDAPFRRYAFGYVLLLPALGLTALWLYGPLVWGLGLSMMDYRLALDSVFVGVDNFAAALFDERFWEGFARTFYFVGLTIALGFWPPILLAILLDEVPTEPLKYVFRTLYYLPAIVSGVIMMFLWKELYNPSSYGVLNQLLLSLNALGPVAATLVKLMVLGLWLSLVISLIMLPLRVQEMAPPLKLAMWAVAAVFVVLTAWPIVESPGAIASVVGRFELTPLRWIDSPDLAMLCVVIPTVWAGAGPGCLLYLAALKTIPQDLYEAAAIDGAGLWHRVFFITLPRLRYLIAIEFIAAVIAAFKGGTDYILALTGGGPNGATMILALEIFIQTFGNLRFGLGAAMAWMLGAVLIGFTAFQLKMLARADFRAGGAA